MIHRVPNISRTKMEQLIDDNIIGFKAERNRAILKRRLLDGRCYEPLAEEFDMSPRQVRNICYKGMEIIAKKLP